MKRDNNLIPLSKEHHFGLLCAWKVREAVKLGIDYDRIKNYINYFWNERLQQHFKTEDLAFKAINKNAKFFKMEDEHQKIQELVVLINQSKSTQSLLDFAELLQNHIRFEERDLFPFLETELENSALVKIGYFLSSRCISIDDDYFDKFWRT